LALTRESKLVRGKNHACEGGGQAPAPAHENRLVTRMSILRVSFLCVGRTHRTTGLDRPMAEQLSRLIEGAVEAASRA